MRDDLNPQHDYAEALSGPLPDYLLEVERQTHLTTLAPQMLSGRLQGRLLSMLALLLRPRHILEIGTFTGYSALCLAEGLMPAGRLDTLEGNPENVFWARRNIATSPYAEQIVVHEGPARKSLETLPGPYDLIFLDGDKRGYPGYLELLLPRLNPGGLLLADNVLWDGKARKTNATDPDVAALRAYNERVRDHPELAAVVLPLRDGLSVARRIEN